MTTSAPDLDLGSALQQIIASYADEQKLGLEAISAETLLNLITSNAKEIYPSCATRIIMSHETKWDTSNEISRSRHRARLLRVVPGASSVIFLESGNHTTLRSAIDELYRLTAKAVIDLDFGTPEIIIEEYACRLQAKGNMGWSFHAIPISQMPTFILVDDANTCRLKITLMLQLSFWFTARETSEAVDF